MATESIENWELAKPRRQARAEARRGIKSSHTRPDLPNFIGQILGQYRDLLVHEIERDVKSKALAAVQEETRNLHNQARERLRLLESDVQQRVQAVLDRAREGIFEMVREEMEEVFSELETRLPSLLEDPEVNIDPQVSGSAQEELEKMWYSAWKEGAATEASPFLEEDTVAEEPGREGHHLEVRLELPPPLELKPLLGFYRGLSEAQDIRILRTLGSVEKGVALYIRPKQPEEITDLLRALPGVREVRDGGSIDSIDIGNGDSPDDSPTLRVLLTPMG